jgi:hypothetical protein
MNGERVKRWCTEMNRGGKETKKERGWWRRLDL